MIKFKRIDDGTVPGEHTRGFQRYDCTVQALSNALSLPYYEVHKMLADAGRQTGRCFAFYNFMENHPQIAGYTATHVTVPRKTLAQVLRDFPKGIFILRKPGHVFAVKDGIVFDYQEPGARIRIVDIWHFSPIAL